MKKFMRFLALFVLVTLTLANQSFAQTEFTEILSKTYTGIVNDGTGERVRSPMRGNLLKVVAKDCRALDRFQGLNLFQISPDGRYRTALPIELQDRKAEGNDIELLFRVNYGVATTINSIGVNTYFGNSLCNISYLQANTVGDDECGEEYDCTPVLATTSECMAERFSHEDPTFSERSRSSEKESTCTVVSRLKKKICNSREINSPSEYMFYCRR